MNCAEVERLLIEGLESADRPEVVIHLAECHGCSELRRQLEEIEDLNRALAHVAGAPRGFSGRVAAEASRGRSWRRGWGVLMTALAGLALLGAGLHWSDGLADSARRVADRISDRPGSFAEARPEWDFRPALETPRLAHESGLGYSEVLIIQPSGDSTIVRIPSTIQIRRTGAVDRRLTKVSY